jgi:hypothetical protein
VHDIMPRFAAVYIQARNGSLETVQYNLSENLNQSVTEALLTVSL